MPAAYQPIATTTLGSNSATVNFTNISTDYTDLILIGGFSVNQAAPLKAWVGNGSIDTGSNYSNTDVRGDGSTTASGRASNQAWFNSGYINDSSQTTIMIHFMDYSNTTTNKTVLWRVSNAAASSYAVQAQVGLWRSTSAINYIRLETNQSPQVFATGSIFTLYGVKAG